MHKHTRLSEMPLALFGWVCFMECTKMQARLTRSEPDQTPEGSGKKPAAADN